MTQLRVLSGSSWIANQPIHIIETFVTCSSLDASIFNSFRLLGCNWVMQIIYSRSPLFYKHLLLVRSDSLFLTCCQKSVFPTRSWTSKISKITFNPFLLRSVLTAHFCHMTSSGRGIWVLRRFGTRSVIVALSCFWPCARAPPHL